ncbi:C4-dicarboxylate transporter [Bradyrhizobium sp. USDA 4541]|nr:C4-dicarboxylate transporter [Bradyrhizobium sp. USDA 4541]
MHDIGINKGAAIALRISPGAIKLDPISGYRAVVAHAGRC